ncbi:alpha/beta fold hydrolase [Lysobacter erysipheiresistens]|uniref:Alpha/beta fold hydrolase n=1 Tax=Novilysobacter erysipheiresistens TaxID=1749332 RepID=A0ABU7YV35_9GAMM
MALQSQDGHLHQLRACLPPEPTAALLWLPALGVAARHYQPFAESLAARGIAVFVHEWRGHGSSSLRASRRHDWGYRELLEFDLSASESGVRQALVDSGNTELPCIIGGHSLGGQLASCRLGMAPGFASRLWLVASGAPYWRAFPTPARYWLPLAYRFLPWLADRCGALPGRRIGFGGTEARRLIADWARSALSGRYRADGLDVDLDAAMVRSAPRVRAVTLADDWLAPESSLRFLLSKMPRATVSTTMLDSRALDARADHFHWMKRPDAIAKALTN